ncbi:MAG: Ig-like domain-containing protein, partial [Clostridiales bacterium]|nr:Ig-like domain-containing protein [Clostridiales bacterium]
MDKKFNKKLARRFFTFALITTFIVGMIPTGYAFFWSKKTTSAKTMKVLVEKVTDQTDSTAAATASDTEKSTKTAKNVKTEKVSKSNKTDAKDKSAKTMEPVKEGDNKSPVTQNLTFETYCNITVAGKLKAIDPEGDALTFQIVQKPDLGEVTIEGSGFRYVPYQNKSGDDFFTYSAVDANGNTSTPAKVDISVKKRDLKASVTYADMDGNPAHYAAIKLSEAGII